MIRPITPDDESALLALAVACGLFQPSELAPLHQVLTEYFDGKLDSGHCWITDDDGGPVGVAYYAPERMTDGTWNLYMIAVRPDCQRQGRGAKLLRYVEQTLAERGERVLLVETSGLPSFKQTHAFYRHCGFEEEARIRDFHKAGEDKIVFRKALKL